MCPLGREAAENLDPMPQGAEEGSATPENSLVVSPGVTCPLTVPPSDPLPGIYQEK